MFSKFEYIYHESNDRNQAFYLDLKRLEDRWHRYL